MPNDLHDTDTKVLSPPRREWFPWITQAMRSHMREYGGTFATEFTVLGSQLVVYKLAAHFLGKTGFSEYAVARRTISLIYPICLMGIAVALPRFAARAIGSGNEERKVKYFGAAVWCVGAGLCATVLLMNLLPRLFAYLFFAGKQYANLVLPLSILLVGLAMHSLVYSYFRGTLEMRKANLLQLINLGMVPLVAFFFLNKSVQSVLLGMGILTTAVAGVSLPFTPVRYAGVHIWLEAKDLLRYGVQRVPGDFVQMALLTLPVTLVAHFSGMQQAGYVAFGMSVLNMIASMFQPVGLILLPKASRLLAEGDREELRSHVTQLVRATVLISSIAIVVLEIVAAELIKIYLGPNFSEAATVLRVVIIAALPYSLYCVLRNLIDAYHENAVNALNLSIAFATFVALSLIVLLVLRSPFQIPWAFVLSMFLLAVLCRIETGRILAQQTD